MSGGFKKAITKLLIIDARKIISHDFEYENHRVLFSCNDEIIPKGSYTRKYYPVEQFNTIFIGDGISDFSMIGQCDILFAKINYPLERKCIDENISYRVV